MFSLEGKKQLIYLKPQASYEYRLRRPERKATSKCVSRSCSLKVPVTTAAVCSTGQLDYSVFVGHRGSHR